MIHFTGRGDLEATRELMRLEMADAPVACERYWSLHVYAERLDDIIDEKVRGETPIEGERA